MWCFIWKIEFKTNTKCNLRTFDSCTSSEKTQSFSFKLKFMKFPTKSVNNYNPIYILHTLFIIHKSKSDYKIR